MTNTRVQKIGLLILLRLNQDLQDLWIFRMWEYFFILNIERVKYHEKNQFDLDNNDQFSGSPLIIKSMPGLMIRFLPSFTVIWITSLLKSKVISESIFTLDQG